MGVVALGTTVQQRMLQHLPISPTPFSVQGEPLAAAQSFHQLFWHFLTHVPEPCSDSSKTVNSFQRSQCSEFWERLELLGWIAAIPFLLAGGFLFFSWDGIRNKFQLARKRITQGQSTGLGIVTDPAEAASDGVSWWYGVQPITVQVADGKQLVIYLPPEAPIPPPGEKVALYDWGKIGGKKRFFAVLYAPHVAVLHGG